MKLKATALMLALSAIPTAQAFDFQYGGIYYNILSSNSVEVTYPELAAGNYSGTIEVPASINYMFREYTVRGIGRHAFFNCQYLDRVVLPEGLAYINNQAFSRCFYMTEINLPSTLQRIEDSAFEYCEDLTAINIPASVKQLGYAVFYDCLSISAYEVEPGNTLLKSGAEGELFTSDGTTLVQYPAARSAQSYAVPSGVTQITDYAFSPAPNLAEVTIGADVTDVAAATFAEANALERIEVAQGNTHLRAANGVLFNADGTVLKQYPLFRQGDEYQVPDGVSAIAPMAFAGAQCLRALTLPTSVSTIGEYAIYSMPAISSLTVKAEQPPLTETDALGGDVAAAATLYVPGQSIAAYRSAPYWSNFVKITDLNSSAITEIAADATSDPAIYDLQGRRILTPTTPGLYIVNRRPTLLP